MGGATNTVTLQNGTAGETMPDPYLGIIDIEGTLGSVDELYRSPDLLDNIGAGTLEFFNVYNLSS